MRRKTPFKRIAVREDVYDLIVAEKLRLSKKNPDTMWSMSDVIAKYIAKDKCDKGSVECDKIDQILDEV